MREWLIDGDKLYCDWLVSIENCEDADFYRVLMFIQAVLMAANAILSLVICIWRRVVLNATIRSFMDGGNAVTIANMFGTLGFSIHAILLLAHVPPNITIITFPIPVFLGFWAQATFFNAIKEAHSGNMSGYINHDGFNRRKILIATISVIMMSSAIAMLSCASYYEYDPAKGNIFYRASLNLMAISILFFSYFFIRSSISFIKQLNMSLELSRQQNASDGKKERITLLEVSVSRIKRGTAQQILLQANFISIYFLAGNYSKFFMNKILSRIFCSIAHGFMPTSLFLYLIILLYNEIRKSSIEKSLSGRSHDRRYISEKKENDHGLIKIIQHDPSADLHPHVDLLPENIN